MIQIDSVLFQYFQVYLTNQAMDFTRCQEYAKVRKMFHVPTELLFL